MKSRVVLFLAAVVVLIIGIVSVSFFQLWMNKDVLTEFFEEATIEEQAAQKSPSRAIRVQPKPEEDQLVFQEVVVNNYTVELPQSWKIELQPEASAPFWMSLTDGLVDRGFITCPIPETGFEAWEFTTQDRSLASNDGANYRVEHWYGEPRPDAGVEVYDLFFMHKGQVFSDWGEDFEASCLIGVKGVEDREVIQSIFERIRLSQ